MVYAATFGLIGRHALVALVVQVALVAVVALLLRALLARFVPESLALATTATWVLVPNHGSLVHWTSATAITCSLALLLGGLLVLDDGRPVVAALLLASAVLTYEATAPAAVLGVVLLPQLRGRPWPRPALIGAAALGPAGVWMLANLPDVKDEGLARTADLSLVLPAHVGWGVFPDGPVAVIGGALACVALALVAVDSTRRRVVDAEAALVAAGVVVILAGTLPFVRYFYAPLGAGDRVNVVAGVGTALLWTGLGAWVARRVPRPVAVGVAACVASAMGMAAWQASMSWADAADDSARILRALPPLDPGDEVVVERPPVRRNVAAFADPSNLRGAVQLEAGTRDVDARFRPGR